MSTLRILVVDDDPVTRSLLTKTLSKAEHEVDSAEDGAHGIRSISNSFYDVVITDLMMPGGPDGIDVLEQVKSRNLDTEVFLLTGYATVDTAVTAMKKGAADYLQKPVNIEELRLRLKNIERMKDLARNAGDLREAMDITEKNAGATIQNMEIMISNLEKKLASIKQTLLDKNQDPDLRIYAALEMLP